MARSDSPDTVWLEWPPGRKADEWGPTMTRHRTEDIESVRKQWTERADRYDNHYASFEGAVEHHVDWEILEGHLPPDRNAKVLDAAGGTGRVTLPLAKMGYSITLCDIAPGMLDVARKKLRREGVLGKVEIMECDIADLPFADESFDFVICWDGMSREAATEIIRVTRKGGRISAYLVNRLGSAISEFHKDPDAALALLREPASEVHRPIDGYAYEPLTMNADEARQFFESQGIAVGEVYAVCGLLRFFSLPQEVRDSQRWEDKLFAQTVEMLLRLSKEPALGGLAWHLALYGERR